MWTKRIVVAELNIEHFRKLLKREPEGPKRQTLLRLLADEKAKLAALKRERSGKPRRESLGAFLPFAPVGRTHVDLLFGFRVDPAPQDATTRKHKRMRAVIGDDG